MITDMNARVAMAQKLSIPQLQQAIKNGTVPAYVGVPLLQDKMRQQQQMAMAQQGQQQQPPIAEQIMAEASRGGVDQLPSNLPITDDEEDYAGGGIIAFAEPTAQNNNSRVTDPDVDVLERMRIEDPEGYKRLMGGNTISPEFGGSSITPEQDAERVAKIKEDLGYDPSTVYDFLRSPPKTAASPTRGSLTAGISPADVARTEAQLPRIGTPSPKAPPSTSSTGIVAPKATTTAAEAAPAPMSALDQYAAMLMEERKGIAKDRQQAKAMAILQTGLGIAGGTSPNPLANISQGALQGTQAYQQEMKGIRREDADRLKQLMSLGIGKEKLALEAKKLGITENRFNQMYELEKQKIGVMGGQRADSREQAAELARERRVDTMYRNIQGSSWAIGKSPNDILRAAQEAVNAGRDVQETPAAPSGVTVRRIS